MKILYFITKSERGGAQTHVLQLCEYFQKKGDKVALMSNPGDWLEKEAVRLGIKFYPNVFLGNTFNPLKLLKASSLIDKAADDFKPDIIGCHSSTAGFLTRLTIRNRYLTVFTAHGWSFNEGVPWWQKILGAWSERIASRFCAKIICVSSFVKNLGITYKIANPEKMDVIYNGTEIPSLDPVGKQIGSNRIRAVFTARLSQPKDPFMLIEAISKLDPAIKKKIFLSIIGEGEQKEKIKDLVSMKNLEKQVALLGQKDRSEIFNIYKESDLFVLSSKWEGFPYTVIEAMSYGLPIMADNVGGIREAVTPECGILVPYHNVEKWREALEEILFHPEKISGMARASYDIARQKFNITKMLQETEAIYQNIIKNNF
ncbi:MAG TPA: glycosyltransferase family 4 protein [Candidatus Pacearchaeota archaeon]|nr:glycosyltransferase family 4 protein [Candidatus Pacearchaeota archaeon]